MRRKQTEHNDEELRALGSDHFYPPQSNMVNDAIRVAVDDDAIRVAVDDDAIRVAVDDDAIRVAVDDDAIRVAVGLCLGAHCADPTHAVIVVHRLTFRQHTDLVVDRVRVANIATLL